LEAVSSSRHCQRALAATLANARRTADRHRAKPESLCGVTCALVSVTAAARKIGQLCRDHAALTLIQMATRGGIGAGEEAHRRLQSFPDRALYSCAPNSPAQAPFSERAATLCRKSRRLCAFFGPFGNREGIRTLVQQPITALRRPPEMQAWRTVAPAQG
jgi:hypothetical protein